MTDSSSIQPVPKWFMIVAIVALIWNLMGVFSYISFVMISPEALDALPEAERALYESTPGWATGAFAFAVWGGALGALFLILKRSWAVPTLIVSLVAIIVQMYHSFFISNSIEVYGPGGMSMPIMIIIFGVYLVWLARSAKAKGWIT